MKTFLFKLTGHYGNVARYAATANNQSEAAQILARVIGGHRLCTRLDYIKEYSDKREADSYHTGITFIN